jgi:hypothetical protein
MAKDLTTEEVRQLARDMHEEMRNVGIQNNVRALFIADLLLAPTRQRLSATITKSKTTYGGVERRDQSRRQQHARRARRSLRTKSTTSRSTLRRHLSARRPSKRPPFDKKGSLVWYINELYGKIYRMMGRNTSMDALGIFYSEFISFGGGDGNGLGIVLTPEHLCDFMAKLIQVNKNDFVIDTCCGSGSIFGLSDAPDDSGCQKR